MYFDVPELVMRFVNFVHHEIPPKRSVALFLQTCERPEAEFFLFYRSWKITLSKNDIVKIF